MRGRATQAQTPLGCLGIAAALLLFGLPVAFPIASDAIEELRIQRSYVPAQCTIVSARLDTKESSGDSSSSNPSQRGRRFAYHPRFFLSLAVNGKPVEARGYSSRNFERGLAEEEARAAMEKFPPNSQQTCWYDPSEPSRAVLTRERGDWRRYLILIPTGGAILVALLIAAVIAHERFVAPK